MAANLQNITRDNQALTRDNQALTRNNQALTRDNQALTRDNQALTARLTMVEGERARLQIDLRHTQANARALNNEKNEFQRRCEQLEREKMALRNRVMVCRNCTMRVN